MNSTAGNSPGPRTLRFHEPVGASARNLRFLPVSKLSSLPILSCKAYPIKTRNSPEGGISLPVASATGLDVSQPVARRAAQFVGDDSSSTRPISLASCSPSCTYVSPSGLSNCLIIVPVADATGMDVTPPAWMLRPPGWMLRPPGWCQNRKELPVFRLSPAAQPKNQGCIKH